MADDVVPTGRSTALTLPRKEVARYKLPWASKYTEDAANKICDEVAGGRTLDRVCLEEVWAPSPRQARYWMQEHADFERAYEIAVQIRADTFAFETVELADTAIDGVNTDSIRIQIGARQWLAGKIMPKYGDKKVVETTVNANVHTLAQIDVSHMSMEQIHAVELALRKTLGGAAVEEDEGEEED
jgi:hypothetical protein